MDAVRDREDFATRAVANNRKWLADPNAGWEPGLNLSEVSANLLEAGQLIAMYDPPTRTVEISESVRRICRRCGPQSKRTPPFWNRSRCRRVTRGAAGRRRR